MVLVSIISSLIIAIGCFLPWLQLGALFSNRGIDNTDGAVMLVLSVISGALAVNNHVKKQMKWRGVFLLVGLVGIAIAYYDLQEVHKRAQTVAESLSDLSGMFGGEKTNLSTSNFIGSGLYIVILGCVGLILCGLGVFGRSKVELQPNAPTIITVHHGEAPDENEMLPEEHIKTPGLEPISQSEYLVSSITPSGVAPQPVTADCSYEQKLALLHGMIERQQKKILGGGMTDDIQRLVVDMTEERTDAVLLLRAYGRLFHKDLIQELCGLSSSYAGMRENVSAFIDLDIVEDRYPHQLK